MYDIDDGNALAQQDRRVPRAFDCPICSIGDAGRTDEAPLGGPHRDSMTSTVEHRFDDGITGNQALVHEPGDDVSAFSYVGYSHAEPLSQNDRVVASSSVTSRQ